MLTALLSLPWVYLVVLLPGYALGRPWLSRRDAALLSLPLSVVGLHSAVIALELVRAPITGLSVGALLTASALISFVASGRSLRGSPDALRAELQSLIRGALSRARRFGLAELVAVAALLALLIALSVDFSREPLIHSDNLFRWRQIAEQLHARHNLGFYPPTSPEEFAVYVYPDGIPPALPVMFWWCFTAVGSASALNVLGFLHLEALWLVLLAVGVARKIQPRASAPVAVLLCCSSSILWLAVDSGSEGPLLALGMLGSLYCLLAARELPQLRWSVLAGCCAAVSALSREYGVATLLLTLLVIVARRPPLRSLAVTGATAALLVAPWYLRTWARTGNPFYVIELGRLFPTIPSYSFYLHRVGRERAISALPNSERLRLAAWLFYGAPLVWLLALPGVIRLRQRALLPVLFAGLSFCVYLAATSYSSGGWGFAFRVVSPCLVILSALIAAGLTPPANRSARLFAGVVVCMLVLKTGLDLLSGPAAGSLRRPPHQLLRPLSPVPSVSEDVAAKVRSQGGRVLSSDAQLQRALTEKGLELAPIWSPEFSFLFDPTLPPDEVLARLRQRGVRVYDEIDWTLYAPTPRAAELRKAFEALPLLSDQASSFRWQPSPVDAP